jgi:hypothetical protein
MPHEPKKYWKNQPDHFGKPIKKMFEVDINIDEVFLLQPSAEKMLQVDIKVDELFFGRMAKGSYIEFSSGARTM